MHRRGWSPFWTRFQALMGKRSGWGQWPHFKNWGDERVRKCFAWPWSAGGVSGCSPDQGEFWGVVTGWRFNKTYLVPLLILFWAFGFQVRRTAQGLKGIFPFARRPDSKIITRLFLCTVGVVPCFALLLMAIKWPDYTLTTVWTTDRTTLLFRRLQFELQNELHFDYIFDAFVKMHVPEQNDLC